MSQQNIKVGETLYVSRLQHRTMTFGEPEYMKVTKVGRDWFYIGSDRFRKDTKVHDGGQYSPQLKVWDNYQQYADDQEAKRLTSQITKFFNQHGQNQMTLQQLRRIVQTIESIGEIPKPDRDHRYHIYADVTTSGRFLDPFEFLSGGVERFSHTLELSIKLEYINGQLSKEHARELLRQSAEDAILDMNTVKYIELKPLDKYDPLPECSRKGASRKK